MAKIASTPIATPTPTPTFAPVLSPSLGAFGVEVAAEGGVVPFAETCVVGEVVDVVEVAGVYVLAIGEGGPDEGIKASVASADPGAACHVSSLGSSQENESLEPELGSQHAHRLAVVLYVMSRNQELTRLH